MRLPPGASHCEVAVQMPHSAPSPAVGPGLMIREVGPVGWLRVSIGTPDEMEAFKQALAAVGTRPQ